MSSADFTTEDTEMIKRVATEDTEFLHINSVTSGLPCENLCDLCG